MPVPYTVLTSVDQYDLSFIEDDITIDLIKKFIAHLIVYQEELGTQYNLCELIYVREVIDGDLFVRYINYMSELRKRMLIIFTHEGEEKIIDVYDSAFAPVQDLIVYGYEGFKEMYFLHTHKLACVRKRNSGIKTERIMKEYCEVEMKMSQMKLAKTQEKINHWFSKDF